jgi:hypothetical protein
MRDTQARMRTYSFIVLQCVSALTVSVRASHHHPSSNERLVPLECNVADEQVNHRSESRQQHNREPLTNENEGACVGVGVGVGVGAWVRGAVGMRPERVVRLLGCREQTRTPVEE